MFNVKATDEEEFTFQYGSNQMQMYEIRKGMQFIFTFQYGSNQIFFLKFLGKEET